LYHGGITLLVLDGYIFQKVQTFFFNVYHHVQITNIEIW